VDVERLNSGEVDTRRHKRARLDDGLALAAAAQSGVSNVQMGLRKARGADNVDDGTRRSRLNDTAFTTQTNALDVDRHLLAFIETELRKRRGDDGQAIDAEKELRSLDPRDELYKIAEKFDIERKRRDEDGSIALSTAMLSAVPEVDLGIEARLRNIEDTEKAKRRLFEQQEAEKNKVIIDDGGFAAARFLQPVQRKKPEAPLAMADGSVSPASAGPAPDARRQFASDDRSVARYKERQANRGRLL